MKNKKILLGGIIISIILLITCVYVSSNDEDFSREEDKFLKKVNTEETFKHIQVLSEDIGERVDSSTKEEEASKYIYDEFKKLGYEVSIQEFEYEQDKKTKTSQNVIATKKPDSKFIKDKNDTDEIVYVSAHCDSVPESPGANDNGSGVATMLEIARIIQEVDIDKEVRFIAFVAEEIGVEGSKAYVNSLTDEEINKSVGNFNIDMVATNYYFCTELAVYTSDGKENSITDIVEENGEKLDKYSSEKVDYDGAYDGKMGYSDHVSFTSKGIDAVLFMNADPAKKYYDPRYAAEPYYHKPHDMIKNVSKERLERSVKLVGLSIYNALNEEVDK